MRNAGYPAALSIFLLSNDRPAILPDYRLQMDDSAISPAILKMQKPFFTAFRIHQRPLMRSIDRRITLMHHNPFLIRPIYLFGAQYRLPSCGYSARGRKNGIPSIPLIHLRSFNCLLCNCSVKNQPVFRYCLTAIPRHFK